jgi:hypothetical protein
MGRRMPGVILPALLLGAAARGAWGAPPTPASPLPVQVATGYRAVGLDLKGAVLAVSPGGRAAVAQNASEGGATIVVYDRLEAGDRKLLQTVKAPAGEAFKFFGGLVFKDDDTLFFSENGVANTVYSASVGTGEVRALAPKGSLPSVADLAIRRSDGLLFALVTPGPGQGAVYTVSGGQASLFAKGLGIGYVAGLAFSPTERLFVGDTADPAFAGKPGQILELGASGEVVQAIPLAAGGGTGLGGLAVDAEGDLFASTGATITEVPLRRGAAAQAFARFSGMGPFPGELLFRGSRFEPASGDGMLLVDGGFTDVAGFFEVTSTAEKPFLPGDFATHVIAFNGTNGKPGFNLRPEAALGPPSAAATPAVPDNGDIVSFGWGGSITLAFDRPILHDPLHPGGYDFIVYGNSFYVGGDPHITFQGPAYVEVGDDLNGNGVPDPGEPFYLLRGKPDPGAPPQFPLPADLYGAVDHRQIPMLGYADVTPTDGSGDPLLPNTNDPVTGGITPGSAGGDGFDLSWAVDAQGQPVKLDHADFVRITAAVDATNPVFGRSATQVDAVSLVRPLPR